jgi:hypothetical protein
VFSFSDLRKLYATACGGRCEGKQVTWNMLRSAAITNWQANSDKTNYFLSKAATYGVVD